MLYRVGMPTMRSDLIDAYIFRRSHPGRTELLQLRRTGEPMRGTWQPVMGHIEPGETAVACMWREIHEETGLARPDTLGAWALEQVHPFFLAETDELILSPRFAIEVAADWQPTLNEEHDDARWVPIAEAPGRFLWPGQHAAIAELRSMLNSPARVDALRLH